MKLMRWAMCVAAFAVVGGTAMSEDYIDVQALQAKLAAQEARLNDLQAKMYGSACEDDGKIVAEGITSLRKNATVTIGGTVNTRYDYYSGKIESRWNGYNSVTGQPTGDVGPGNRVKRTDVSHGGIAIADAKLEGKIDVNEFFDAYFKFDLQNGSRGSGSYGDNTWRDSPANVAQNYWVRWKNVCNTGFGVLVGRDSLKFGGTQPYGRWDSWNKGMNDMGGGSWGAGLNDGLSSMDGLMTNGGMPTRIDWANSRTVQVTPYWETQDGRFKAEVSFFQSIEDYGDVASVYTDGDGVIHRRRMNNGLGSMSGRITWKPIDGLTMRASVINLHAKHYDGQWGYYNGKWGNAWNGYETSKNNFAMNLGFEYRPAFFNRLNVFAAWTRSWNDGWVKDQDSNSVIFGLGIDVLDNLTLFGFAEHLSAKAGQTPLDSVTGGFSAYKGKGWAHEIGLRYALPYGASLSGGWRHERMTYQNRSGEKHTKLTRDGFYAQLGFDF